VLDWQGWQQTRDTFSIARCVVVAQLLIARATYNYTRIIRSVSMGKRVSNLNQVQ
jgi:hypothetical protein